MLDVGSVFGYNSSGVQLKKWYIIDNIPHLLKVDTWRDEAKKEVYASKLAKAFGLYCVDYKLVTVKHNGVKKLACLCESFLESGLDTECTLYDFISAKLDDVVSFKSGTPAKEIFDFIVDTVDSNINLGKSLIINYLLMILTFDFIICNEDRHLNNISLIERNGEYRFAPLFDNGNSFLGVNSAMPLSEIRTRSRALKPKPFSSNQKKNLINIVYCKNLLSSWLRNAGDLRKLGIPMEYITIVEYSIKELMRMEA